MRSRSLIRAISLTRRIYGRLFNPVSRYGHSYDHAEVTGQEASDLIKRTILQDSPAMIGRLGSSEFNCVLNYINVNQPKSLKKYFDYIRGDINYLTWAESTFTVMHNNAGLFPPRIEMLERFARLMLEDMQCVDILGCYSKEELFFDKQLSQAAKTRLQDLEPYYHKDPWSGALKGRKVLVVHPLELSIKNQYKKRHLLFNDARILPAFELKTLKAVQSLAGNRTEFKDWFDALDYMKNKINAIDFDIAIIGCGAYGFPLAAHVKRIGKKSIQLGGPVQILFGIRGRRWEEHPFISRLMNEHWVRPLPEEVPEHFQNVENGGYW